MSEQEENRKKRIWEISEAVRKLKGVEKEPLIAECMMKWGCSRRITLEYIKILIVLNKMRESKGRLIWGKKKA